MAMPRLRVTRGIVAAIVAYVLFVYVATKYGVWRFHDYRQGFGPYTSHALWGSVAVAFVLGATVTRRPRDGGTAE